MGGIGSGDWQHGKDTTSGYRSLDVRRLQRDNLLSPGLVYTVHWTREKEDVAVIEICTQAGRLILNYKHRSPQEDWRILKYPVLLDWTDCTFGGRRAWFRCPANGCGRRVALLYLGRAGIFACRHCYRLVYNSTFGN